MTRPGKRTLDQTNIRASASNDGAPRHYFAYRMTSFVTLGALPERGDGYLADYLRRQVELVSCLVNAADERFTYDLRWISEPDCGLYTRGSITLALAVRADGGSPAEAEESRSETLRLLQSTLSEVDLEPVPAAEIDLLLAPFPVNHLTSVIRRCEWQPLDSLSLRTHRPRVGFRPVRAGGEDAAGDGAVFHVFPFLPVFPEAAGLIRRLLLHPNRVMLSFRLRPTSLTHAEHDFLESQIARCEKYSQLQLSGFSDDLEGLRPTLQHQARLHEQHFLRALAALEDDAALLSVEIASPEPLPQVFVDAVAHFVSEPAAVLNPGGRGSTDPAQYLAGGYELLPRDTEPAALAAPATLDLILPSHPLAKSEAHRLLHLFDPGEALAAFRFPQATMEAPAGVPVRRVRYRLAPPNLPEHGVLLGVSQERGARQEVRLETEDRLRHVYLVGQTGTGKTTMLRSMIVDDIEKGHGVCVVDPHGDLFHEVLARIPEERAADLVVLDPTDIEHPFGLNLLEVTDESQRYFVVSEMMDIIVRLSIDSWGSGALSMMGPIFMQEVRNNLLLVTSDPDNPGTLLDFCRVFTEPNHFKRWMPLKLVDPMLSWWVEKVLPRRDYNAHDRGDPSMGAYVESKFEEFVFDPMLRNIFGQRCATINFRQIMDGERDASGRHRAKILLVNLAKGMLTESKAKFLGMIVLAKLLAAAMSRVRMPEEERRPFFTYVDEFQAIATSNFISMLSEGRKFGLGLVLANQFVSQLQDAQIVGSIFGNVGTLVAFRTGQPDAEMLEKYMAPVFARSDLATLPNWHAVMTTLVGGQAVEPFTVETVLPAVPVDEARAERLRAVSRLTYGRPRATVERELNIAHRAEEGEGEATS